MIYANQALARKVNGNWYYYIYNAHGDVIGLTDSQGNIVNSYEYDAWGNILSQTETIDNPLKYAGQYYDDELQMYYLRARYYDPSIGRFTSIDAIEGNITQPLDMNQYVYCRNNPIIYIDTTGKAVYGLGGGGSGGLAVYGSLQGFYVWDDYGNKGFIVVLGLGGGFGAALSGNGFTYPNMNSIHDLKGFGGAAGGGFGIGGELQMAPGNTGVGISGSKIGIDFHGIGTYTWLIEF